MPECLYNNDRANESKRVCLVEYVDDLLAGVRLVEISTISGTYFLDQRARLLHTVAVFIAILFRVFLCKPMMCDSIVSCVSHLIQGQKQVELNAAPTVCLRRRKNEEVKTK